MRRPYTFLFVCWTVYFAQNTFRALYRSFTECCFIEDEGDIVFYKNKDGHAARELDSSEAISRVSSEFVQ